MSLLARTASLEPPPRRVPLALTIEQVLGTDRTRASLCLSMFATIFLFSFGLRSELVKLLEWRGRVIETSGEVVSVSETSSRENKARIYEVSYREGPRYRASRGSEGATSANLPASSAASGSSCSWWPSRGCARGSPGFDCSKSAGSPGASWSTARGTLILWGIDLAVATVSAAYLLWYLV